MKICLLLLLTIIAVETAVPITELVVNRIYCNSGLPLVDCNVRVQRKNKTAQMVTGFLQFKQPYFRNISMTLHFRYQDHSGVWKGLSQRTYKNSCNSITMMVKSQIERYVRMEPKCPINSGNYTIGPAIINRYRKDWEEDLKSVIPPYFMEADNWKVFTELFYDNDPNVKIAETTFEFRLLNERMSQ